MKQENNCETCINYGYDDEYENYYCLINIDEDELERSRSYRDYSCPYFRFGDEYSIVRKQN